MKLSVADRMNILRNMFPLESNFVSLRAMKSIQAKIDFSTKDLEAIDYKEVIENGRVFVKWNKKMAKDIEIKFDKLETKFLVEQVERLDKENKIPAQSLELFEEIMKLKEE